MQEFGLGALDVSSRLNLVSTCAAIGQIMAEPNNFMAVMGLTKSYICAKIKRQCRSSQTFRTGAATTIILDLARVT